MAQNNVDTVNILNEADLNDITSPVLTDTVHLTRGRKATLNALKTVILTGESTDITDINVPTPTASTVTVQAITGSTTNSTTIPAATSSTAGAMTAEQAAKVATIPTGGVDGSETKLQNGTNINITGSGTIADPYVVNSTATGGGGGAVDSVNGETGTVTLDTGDIAENGNLYYTEARVSANSNVAANTAKVTAHPLIDDDTLATATATNVASAESIKAYVDANAGGSSTFTVTTGTNEFMGEYVGSAPTITETGTNGIYSIVVPQNSSILWFDFKGNANDVNASGNITFNYDNSANGVDRRFDVTPFALIGGNANKPLNKFGSTDYVETQTVTSNVTSIVIPNLGGTGTTQDHTFLLTIK